MGISRPSHRRMACVFIFAAGLPAGVAAGWNTGLDLTLEGSASLSGGSRRGETVQALLLGYGEWKREASDGWQLDVEAYGSVLAHAGHGPTERFLGDFLGASNMEAHSSLRLYSWWLEVSREGWSLRSGALLADEEFAGTAAGGNFLNSAFGWPAFISANARNTGPAYYVPALGVRLERTWRDAVVWRLGIYDGDTFDSPEGDPRVNRHGVRFSAGGEQGWLVLTEVAWAPGDRAVSLKAGIWLHTGEFADVRDDDAGRPFALTGTSPRLHDSNQGAYVAVERDWEGGWQMFVRGGWAPADRNQVAWGFDAGVSKTGPLPGRPTDVVFAGVAHAGFSSRLADIIHETEPEAPASDFEQVFEIGYTLALTGRWSLQPDLQYIRHPGGRAGQRDAWVFLLRTTLRH